MLTDPASHAQVATSPVVETRDLSVALDGRPILRGIDMVVGPGEFVALLGANGSGKSTLVRTITGLVPIARGEVDLFGQPVHRFDAWRRIGFVPQRAGAGSGVPATVAEVVSSGRLSHRRLFRRISAADRDVIARALATVDLADRANEPVSALSGGQQQRVLIARALATEPDLLIMDEPTAGVDAANQEALAATLGRLSGEGVAVLLVAHELGPLAPLLDRVVVLSDGRVRHAGPAEDVLDLDVHRHHGHHAPPPLRDHLPQVGHPLDPAPELPYDLTPLGHEDHR